MDSLQLRALLSGVFFGTWPLLMNRSGLSGNFSSVVFTAIILVCVTPLVIGNVGNLANVSWVMALGAGVIGALGLMTFNGMLAKATPQNVSTLFVMMIVVQAAIPAAYNIFMTGELTMTRALGFLFAIIAGTLLTL